MTDAFGFKEPAKKKQLSFAVLPASKLEVISHQRKPSDPHVKRLVTSIERIGFVAPVVVVERGNGYVVIDGQHRLLAAQSLGLKTIPAVIVPEDLARRMLNLNVEKEPNIRERSAVALSIYREMVSELPKLAEDEAQVADAVEQAHFVTLGLGYEQSGRLAGSSFAPIL
ncbi:MAG: ParB/RepB/Spo0J family partition protein, partial [Actinomycetota bacterium]